MRKSIVIGIGVVVVLLALGAFGPGAITAVGAEPNFCATCHVMDKNVSSFKASESAHHGVLSCTDCHLPNGGAGLEGWTSHYSTGIRHVSTTVQGKTPASLELTEEARKILVDNCVRCHAGQEHIQQNGRTACLTCHANDPHGEKGVTR
jgi:cytochrome c nitrite reductase small subunit